MCISFSIQETWEWTYFVLTITLKPCVERWDICSLNINLTVMILNYFFLKNSLKIQKVGWRKDGRHISTYLSNVCHNFLHMIIKIVSNKIKRPQIQQLTNSITICLLGETPLYKYYRAYFLHACCMPLKCSNMAKVLK